MLLWHIIILSEVTSHHELIAILAQGIMIKDGSLALPLVDGLEGRLTLQDTALLVIPTQVIFELAVSPSLL